jgi:competence protein ComGC
MKPMIKHRRGFTLTEALITFGVIGVLASLTLPSMLESTTTTNTYTPRWKEAYKVMESIVDMYSTEDMATRPTFNTYFFSKIKAKKKCPTAGITEGCYNTGFVYGERPTVVLESGVNITVFDAGAGTYFQMDANGKDAPNAENEDILVFYANTTAEDKVPYADAGLPPSVQRQVRPGELVSFYSPHSASLEEQQVAKLVEDVMKTR